MILPIAACTSNGDQAAATGAQTNTEDTNRYTYSVSGAGLSGGPIAVHSQGPTPQDPPQ
jgi:hypothetical protein